LHRADLQHLLQVAPPFLLALASLFARFTGGCVGRNSRWRLLGLVGYTVTAALLVAIVPDASIDLAGVWRDPVRYWRTIANLPESRREEPVADMAMAIRRLSTPEASLFLVMSTSRMPLLFFALRHQAGIFPVYEAGMFTGLTWLTHNRLTLTRTPPDFLVMPQPGSVDDSGEPAPFMPDLTTTWLQCYTKEIYANTRYRLLAR
jgi:hypothetical protein